MVQHAAEIGATVILGTIAATLVLALVLVVVMAWRDLR